MPNFFVQDIEFDEDGDIYVPPPTIREEDEDYFNLSEEEDI